MMQLFAFDTTWRCADYFKISNQSDQQCLPTEQLKFVNLVSTISLERLKPA
ncbi:hypothetical protein O3M35_007834 [Rhynocoris fuscipes]|uniref:Uncharacterized protein n=1 Tax=Rhynocoris fuscipes TaxID=488301 RepID=A0AAW1DCC4_9HEMI